MISFAFSIHDTGLLVIAVILVILYSIVLIKLKPSTEGGNTSKPKSLEQNTHEAFSSERRNNPVIPHENREETEERVKFVEKPESLQIEPVRTEKTEFPQNNQSFRCPRHFGYLKEHPKNTPIPNECLTCTKIMMCLAREE